MAAAASTGKGSGSDANAQNVEDLFGLVHPALAHQPPRHTFGVDARDNRVSQGREPVSIGLVDHVVVDDDDTYTRSQTHTQRDNVPLRAIKHLDQQRRWHCKYRRWYQVTLVQR